MSATAAARAQSASRQAETFEYIARLACARTEWPSIEEAFQHLQVADRTHFHPGFFLAHLCPYIWRPTIILVFGPGQKPAGMMFLKERTVHGFGTGLFFGDTMLGCVIASQEHQKQQIFRAGMSALMQTKRVRGLRLLTGTSGDELKAMEHVPVPAYLKTEIVPTECHQILKLAPTYEQFLTTLSYKTRRNFRYFRKRSGNAGHNFIENPSFDEFVRAAWKLQSEQTVGGHRAPFERAMEVLKTAPRPLLVTLMSADEEMLSFVGGWWEGSRAVVFMQLNSDKRHHKDSLSLTMRTYLIEYLIENRCTEILWWSGVIEPIKRYCEPVPTVAICLDHQGLVWRLGRKLLESGRSLLPRRFHALAHMVIAPTPAEIREKEEWSEQAR